MGQVEGKVAIVTGGCLGDWRGMRDDSGARRRQSRHHRHRRCWRTGSGGQDRRRRRRSYLPASECQHRGGLARTAGTCRSPQMIALGAKRRCHPRSRFPASRVNKLSKSREYSS
jgi:hypothetical protein